MKPVVCTLVVSLALTTTTELDEPSRHFRELREHGCAHGGVLTLEASLQSKKIQSVRFEPVKQATFVWRSKACWQSEALAQTHVRFRFHSQNFVQPETLFLEFLL